MSEGIAFSSLLLFLCVYILLGAVIFSLVGLYCQRNLIESCHLLSKEIDKENFRYKKTFEMLAILSQRAGIRTPTVVSYDMFPVIDENYFCSVFFSSKSNSVIVFSEDLFFFGDKEIEAILAHEIGHIARNDYWKNLLPRAIFISLVFGMYVSFVTVLSAFFSYLFVAYSAVEETVLIASKVFFIFFGATVLIKLLELWRLRLGEFSADTFASELVGDPNAMATALKKADLLCKTPVSLPVGVKKSRRLLFGIQKLFSSHPPIEKRIERLNKLALLRS